MFYLSRSILPVLLDSERVVARDDRVCGKITQKSRNVEFVLWSHWRCHFVHVLVNGPINHLQGALQLFRAVFYFACKLPLCLFLPDSI